MRHFKPKIDGCRVDAWSLEEVTICIMYSMYDSLKYDNKMTSSWWMIVSSAEGSGSD